MARYIDADALKERMLNYYECVNPNTSKENYKGETLMNYEVADMIEDCIDNAPTADVAEVRHGHNATSMHPVDEFVCSVCGFICNDYTEAVYDEDGDYTYYRECEFKYCPNCGAKMDGEVTE